MRQVPSKSNQSGIYEIVNLVNGKCYIGSARNIPGRWKEHRFCLSRNKHKNRHLQNSWNKHGADNFEFRVLELCEISQLIEREQVAIDICCPEFNVCSIAGSMLGFQFSEASKQKMSVALRSAWAQRRETGEWERTPETRALMSETWRRIWAERKENGEDTSHTPETKAKMSAAWDRRKARGEGSMSAETRAKMSIARQKTAAEKKANGENHLTPEGRARMIASKREWWAKRKADRQEPGFQCA